MANCGRAALHRGAQNALPRGDHRDARVLPSIRRPPLTPSSTEEQNASGVSEAYVRLSVGIEHIDDTPPTSTRRSRRLNQPPWLPEGTAGWVQRDRTRPAA